MLFLGNFKRVWQGFVDALPNRFDVFSPQVNSIRVAAVLSVLILVMLLLYLFYLTAYKNGNRTVHFKGNAIIIYTEYRLLE